MNKTNKQIADMVKEMKKGYEISRSFSLIETDYHRGRYNLLKQLMGEGDLI